MTEAELKKLSGVTGFAFKEALIKLEEQHLVVKWKSEKKVNYLVHPNFARKAYYLEPLTIPDIYAAFGHVATNIMVTRTIPFIILDDTELRKYRRNRYLDEIEELESVA